MRRRATLDIGVQRVNSLPDILYKKILIYVRRKIINLQFRKYCNFNLVDSLELLFRSF